MSHIRCPYCGKELLDNSVYCSKCGRRISFTKSHQSNSGSWGGWSNDQNSSTPFNEYHYNNKRSNNKSFLTFLIIGLTIFLSILLYITYKSSFENTSHNSTSDVVDSTIVERLVQERLEQEKAGQARQAEQAEAAMAEQEGLEQERLEQEKAEQQRDKQQGLEGTTWYYYQKEDDLTHEVTSINAIIISTNRVQFDSHGNTARMCLSLKYSSDGLSSLSTSVMLTFVEDNELCRFSDFKGSGFLAVFDNGEVDDRWSLIGMIDSRKALFMDMPSDVTPFVNKLKTSKNVRIQVNLEDVGKKTFDFNIAGLKWNFDK